MPEADPPQDAREAARRLLNLQADPAGQARIDYLAERANEGLLTDDERREYETLVAAASAIAIAKAKARALLNENSSG